MGELTGATAPPFLERLLPAARMVEVDSVDLALPVAGAWEVVRHADLARSPAIRALFAIRTAPARLRHRTPDGLRLRLDDIGSSPDRPGFQILVDDPPHEVVVGAVGKVWRPAIAFRYVPTAEDFAAFEDAGYVKVAWAIRLTPLGGQDTRVTVEVRVGATDEESWRRFRRYFAVIGPWSRLIRRTVLSGLAREYGTQKSREVRPLPGDDLLPDAVAQVTHARTLRAQPEDIWPWLAQMGRRRAGFYSIDALDNGCERSAREIHPELQDVRVGDVLPATPKGTDGFEVLGCEPGRALVLGGLYDVAAKRQRAFGAPRPPHFWQVTWAFALTPDETGTTRLQVRTRAAYPAGGGRHATWIRSVHHLMQTAQLRHLAARVEGRQPRDDWRDIAEGLGGAAVMVGAALTPFRRAVRNRWGVDGAIADDVRSGDEWVTDPRWSWTHGVEIEAAAEHVWPWVAQIGADRAGFYSYQWLENLVGCRLRNAETIHPAWAVREGGSLILHPQVPPLRIVSVVPGRSFVAYAGPDEAAGPTARWTAASWLFSVEPLGPHRCRVISRYRAATSDDIPTRLRFGPAIIEPIGFAMDRRMLLGVRRRAMCRAPQVQVFGDVATAG